MTATPVERVTDRGLVVQPSTPRYRPTPAEPQTASSERFRTTRSSQNEIVSFTSSGRSDNCGGAEVALITDRGNRNADRDHKRPGPNHGSIASTQHWSGRTWDYLATAHLDCDRLDASVRFRLLPRRRRRRLETAKFQTSRWRYGVTSWLISVRGYGLTSNFAASWRRDCRL